MSEVDVAPRRQGETGCEVVVQAVGKTVPEVDGLGDWIRGLVEHLSPDSTSLTVRLVDGEEMRSFNRDFRGIDRPTDVLSFPGEATPGERHLGDIVVAVPIARRQAEESGHSLTTELELLALHGILHCMGHDHESDGGEMEALESDLRSRWIPGCSPRR